MPHQHIEELTDFEKTELENPDSFVDYVKIMFLTDLGEGHMESFDQGENFDLNSQLHFETHSLDFPFIAFISASAKPDVACSMTSGVPDDIPFLRRFPDEHIDFRGPPFHV